MKVKAKVKKPKDWSGFYYAKGVEFDGHTLTIELENGVRVEFKAHELPALREFMGTEAYRLNPQPKLDFIGDDIVWDGGFKLRVKKLVHGLYGGGSIFEPYDPPPLGTESMVLALRTRAPKDFPLYHNIFWRHHERENWEFSIARAECPPYADLPPLEWYEVSWKKEEVRRYLMKYPWPRNVKDLVEAAIASQEVGNYDVVHNLVTTLNRMYRVGFARLLKEISSDVLGSDYLCHIEDLLVLARRYFRQLEEVFGPDCPEPEEEE